MNPSFYKLEFTCSSDDFENHDIFEELQNSSPLSIHSGPLSDVDPQLEISETPPKVLASIYQNPQDDFENHDIF